MPKMFSVCRQDVNVGEGVLMGEHALVIGAEKTQQISITRKTKIRAPWSMRNVRRGDFRSRRKRHHMVHGGIYRSFNLEEKRTITWGDGPL